MLFALAAGLLLLAIAVGVVLSRAPLTVARASASTTEAEAATPRGRAELCQANELIPKGTTAIHLSAGALTVGPSLTVRAYSSAGLVTEGKKEAGWRGTGVTLPVARVSHRVEHARICFISGAVREALYLRGEKATAAQSASVGGKALRVRVRIEYLRPDSRAWASLALQVARRLGLGRVVSGSWIALLLAALMASVAAFSSWLVIREVGAGHE